MKDAMVARIFDLRKTEKMGTRMFICSDMLLGGIPRVKVLCCYNRSLAAEEVNMTMSCARFT
jgi:hypothetical protein